MNKFSINLTDGAGYNGPYINKYSAGFDTVEFLVDKSFAQGCTFAVIYSVCGDVGMVTDGGGSVSVTTGDDGNKTVITWSIGTEVTCDSGVVIYQVVAYTSAEDGTTDAVWYSPQGRIVVGESIDTTDYETARIAAEPSLVAQLMSRTNKLYADSVDFAVRLEVLEQLQEATDRRVDSMYGEFTREYAKVSEEISEIKTNLDAVDECARDTAQAAAQNTNDIAQAVTRLTEAEKVGNSSLELAQSLSQRADEADGNMAQHTQDGVIHMTAGERDRAEHFFDIYDANGLLSVSADEVADTNSFLGKALSYESNLRIGFMTGARSTSSAPYNKLKLLDSYGICDYIINGGGYAPDGKILSVPEVLEISKAAGKDVLSMRGDQYPGKTMWCRIFAHRDAAYYYIDDEKRNVRIIVLDTPGMDGAQIYWFVNTALKVPTDHRVIVFSYHNLAKFVKSDSGEVLFKRIFTAAQSGGSLSISGTYSCGDISLTVEDITAEYDNAVEIIATVHGGDGKDSCDNDMGKKFCNLGVADDMPDVEARSQFDSYEVSTRVDTTSTSQLLSVIRATATDVTLDDAPAIKVIPHASDAEVYLVPDDFDTTGFNGYIVIQTDIKVGDNLPDAARFYIATNQSRQISLPLSLRNLHSRADADGWTRVTVVMCRNPDDPNYGKSNTYVNGVSEAGWHVDYLGEVMTSGAVRSEIRIISGNVITDDAIYYRRLAIYTANTMPSASHIAEGLSDSLFVYNGEFYNSSYKDTLLKQLNPHKGCYDVLCIDTDLQKVNCCRFGYGMSRSFDWIVPDVVFE